MTPLRAVLFDHDGTLVNSEPIHGHAWQIALEPYGATLSLDQYRERYSGVTTAAVAWDLVARLGVRQAAGVLANAKNAVIRAYLETTAFPLMPGVREAVSAFSALGLKQAVVTGANSLAAHATLAAHGLKDHFSTVVSGDDVVRNKPAPDCYAVALSRLGLAAAECIAIEDSEHGLRAAAAAGVRCLVIPTEMSRHHDFGLALARLHDMDQARAFVEQEVARTTERREPGTPGMD